MASQETSAANGGLKSALKKKEPVEEEAEDVTGKIPTGE